MKKMNKKGFTLIELLTVIAILAVILLIAAPTILGVLDKAKKNTFKNQVLLYVSGLKTQIALDSIGNDSADMTITWAEDGTATVDVTTIPMDTESLTGGTITVTPVEGKSGQYTYALTNVGNDDYCVASATDASALSLDDISSGACASGE